MTWLSAGNTSAPASTRFMVAGAMLNREDCEATLYTVPNYTRLAASRTRIPDTRAYLLSSTGLLRYARFFLGGSVEPTLPPDPEPSVPESAAPEPRARTTSAYLCRCCSSCPSPLPEAPAYRDRGTGLMIFGVIQIILGLLSRADGAHYRAGCIHVQVSLRAGQCVPASSFPQSPPMLHCGRTDWAGHRIGADEALGARPHAGHILVLADHGGARHRPADGGAAGDGEGRTGTGAESAADTPSADMSTGIMAVMLTLIIVVLAFFLVLVPIAFVIFYSRKDVGRNLPPSRSRRTLDRPDASARARRQCRTLHGGGIHVW